MLRRYTVNHATFSMMMDLGLTLVALLLAKALRPYLPITFPFLVRVLDIDIPVALFVIVPVIWGDRKSVV